MKEYDRVRLLTDKYSDKGLRKGSIGSIVEDYGYNYYGVSFGSPGGADICFALPQDEIEPTEQSAE